MTGPNPPASYHALRADRTGDARAWWRAAESAASTAPVALLPLLRGGHRIEAAPEDAHAAMEWAQQQPGWDTLETKPLGLYVPTTC